MSDYTINSLLKIDNTEFKVLDFTTVDFVNKAQEGVFVIESAGFPKPGIVRFFLAGKSGDYLQDFVGFLSDPPKYLDGNRYQLKARGISAALGSVQQIALKNPSLAGLLNTIEKMVKINFLRPTFEKENQNYLNAIVSCFSGVITNALLQAGIIWKLDYPVWYQMPDGRVYFGAWKDGPWNDKTAWVIDKLHNGRENDRNEFELPLFANCRAGYPVAANNNGYMIGAVMKRRDKMILKLKPIQIITQKVQAAVVNTADPKVKGL